MKVKAKYTNGALMPHMPLDLEEGAEVTLSVESTDELSLEERIKITKSAAGKWKGLHDPEEFVRRVYESRKAGARVEGKCLNQMLDDLYIQDYFEKARDGYHQLQSL